MVRHFRHSASLLLMAVLGSSAAGQTSAGGAVAMNDWFATECAAPWQGDDLPVDGRSIATPAAVPLYDPAVAPAQVQMPPLPYPGIGQPDHAPQDRGRILPFMIGDAGVGTSVGFNGLLRAELSHPTLGADRLNIAAANSPLPSDRLYWSYRHFSNASSSSLYGLSEAVDLDQHTLAWENAFWDRTGSLEVRVPIQQQLASDVLAQNSPILDGMIDPLSGQGGRSIREAQLGNISLIFKMLLIERSQWLVSGGLGATLPTARDVEYGAVIAGPVTYPAIPGLTADLVTLFPMVYGNDAVYLSPFLAWARAPRSRWFHQGFLQVEVAANPNRLTIDGEGAVLFSENGVPSSYYEFFAVNPPRVEVHPQTLMRLNLGWGYIFSESRDPDRFRRWTGLFELHYTTTLQDANLSNVAMLIDQSSVIGNPAITDITAGSPNSRIDILNAAAGVSSQFGRWVVTNGVVAPIRDERCYDFGYNLQLHRMF